MRRSANNFLRYTQCIIFFAMIMITACGLKSPLPDCCGSLNCKAIEVGPGPEDFVLDTWTDSPRLLVSSHERRIPDQNGNIYSYDINSQAVKLMPRKFEPDTLKRFKPQGMDISKQGDQVILYVILHDTNGNGNRFDNAIGIYQVHPDHLAFLKLLTDEKCLWSPNDLSVMPSGEIYVTNDYRTKLDMYLKRNVSEIGYYMPKENKWSIVAKDLGLANGILALPDKVFIGTTFQNQLIQYSRKPNGQLEHPEVIVEIKGIDNLMLFNDKLVLAAHFDDLAFMAHAKDASDISPTVIYLVDTKQKQSEPLYVNKGYQISAGSTAFVYNNTLFISQVFDSHILICTDIFNE